MARTLHRLKAKQLDALGVGRHADGGGLYLVRDKEGRSRWVFMWNRGEVRREMGLGSAGPGGVSLAKARVKADQARNVLEDGGDPIEVRNAEAAPPLRIPTFGELADEYIEAQSPQWRNDKHRAQWEMTLTVYAKSLRDLPVDRVTTLAVMEVLKPIWLAKPETAARLRGRIERVLNASKAQGFRSGENPAQWRGHLDLLLPARRKLSRGHHAALHYTKLPDLITRLRAREAVSATALEFLILTAARTSEVLGATWDEVDMTNRVWTVPAERMKAGRDHRVPLSGRAMALLRTIKPLTAGKDQEQRPIFPSHNGGPLSTNALSKLMERLGCDGTVHGFRSSFRDWAGEVSNHPREVAEAALAHTIGDATERAYRRGDALEKRRKLMDAWAAYIEPRVQGGKIIPFGKTVKSA